uniref:Uncharacterized protein n=1 Tax=Fusarium oxysporum (strain Fo5176) TaxID=660025 RepID=A0A0D2X9S6_FUSOF
MDQAIFFFRLSTALEAPLVHLAESEFHESLPMKLSRQSLQFELQFSNLSKCMSDEVPLHHGGFHKHPRPTTTGHLLLFEHSHLRALVL